MSSQTTEYTNTINELCKLLLNIIADKLNDEDLNSIPQNTMNPQETRDFLKSIFEKVDDDGKNFIQQLLFTLANRHAEEERKNDHYRIKIDNIY